MLRTFQKKQIMELIQSLKSANMQCRELAQAELFDVAQQCQQAAISIGTMLEQETEESEKTVPLLEKYCELVYELTQDVSAISEIDRLLNETEERIAELPVIYQVVFFPYKAAMWDSLESIWRACREDERCECLVVPIPYFEFETVGEKRQAVMHYDGNLFPKDVPVLHYDSYHLEKERPDVAYVHNPFDKYNHVTSVHPNYYSDNLKKYVGTLVYSPYYVTPGFVSDTYLELPSNNNFDVILAQSEYSKTFYSDYPWHNKVFPCGSPKLDKVLRLCKEKPEMPSEWQEILGNRKVLMLNTSINCILQQGDIYLKKLQYIFGIFKGREDIALIWRPHPLLEATLKSMRVDMVEKYHELIRFFNDEKIGVFDTTPDISVTVALSDGYIGEEASSVVNLFVAAGKPVVILNNFIYEEIPSEWVNRVGIVDIVNVNGKLYFNSGWNGIYSPGEEWYDVRQEAEIKDDARFTNLHYGNMVVLNDEIYLTPMTSSTSLLYDTKKKEFRKLFSQNDGKSLNFIGIAQWKDKLYYMPQKGGTIVRCDTGTGEIGFYSECIQALLGNDWKPNLEQVTAWRVFDDALWIVAVYTNRVMKLDLEKGSYEMFAVGTKEMTYTDIEIDGEYIWLAEAVSGNILKCSKQFEILETYEMPDGWKSWTDTLGRSRAFKNMISTEDILYAFPHFSNSAVRIHKTNGQCCLFLKEFYEGIDEVHNGYHPAVGRATGVAKLLDREHMIVQLGRIAKTAIVNLTTGEMELFYTSCSSETFDRLSDGKDGFEKFTRNAAFSYKETPIFTFENFIEKFVAQDLGDAMQRQVKAAEQMSDNRDGTCGEKVHEYVMSRLEHEN